MPRKVSDVDWNDPGDSGWHQIYLKQLRSIIDYASDMEVDAKHVFEFEYCLNKLIEHWRVNEDLDDVWLERKLFDNKTTVQFTINSASSAKSTIYIYLTPKDPFILDYFKLTNTALETIFKSVEEDNG